jgi:HEPN domain-containing protein
MTQQEAVRHWQEGARKALRAAKVLHEDGNDESALFHCHLAVEKALKAAWIAQRDTEEPPHTHDLVALAKALEKQPWTEEDLEVLETLTRFVIDARYADPTWAVEYATKENTERWIEQGRRFISFLQPL